MWKNDTLSFKSLFSSAVPGWSTPRSSASRSSVDLTTSIMKITRHGTTKLTLQPSTGRRLIIQEKIQRGLASNIAMTSHGHSRQRAYSRLLLLFSTETIRDTFLVVACGWSRSKIMTSLFVHWPTIIEFRELCMACREEPKTQWHVESRHDNSYAIITIGCFF